MDPKTSRIRINCIIEVNLSYFETKYVQVPELKNSLSKFRITYVKHLKKWEFIPRLSTQTQNKSKIDSNS